MRIAHSSDWRFSTSIEWSDGTRWQYNYHPRLHEDEYGRDIGSFEEDVLKQARELGKTPVANVLAFWCEHTRIEHHDDEFDTVITTKQKFHKQEQRLKHWWSGVMHEELRSLVEDPMAIVNGTVYDYDKWRYRSTRYK